MLNLGSFVLLKEYSFFRNFCPHIKHFVKVRNFHRYSPVIFTVHNKHPEIQPQKRYFFREDSSPFGSLGTELNKLKPKYYGVKRRGLLDNPLIRDPESIILYCESAELEVESLVEEALSTDRTRSLVQIFDDLSDNLCLVADMAEFVRLSHPNERWSVVAGDASYKLNQLVEKLNTNAQLYHVLKKSLDLDIVPLTDFDKRVVKLFLFDFEQSGIHLDEANRKQFVSLNERIHRIQSAFMDGCSESVTVDIGQRKVTLNSGHVDDSREPVRKLVYETYYVDKEVQAQNLRDLLYLRHKQAEVAGFSNFADRAARGTMLSDPVNIRHFLNSLSSALMPLAQKDLDRMQSLKKIHSKDNLSDPLQHWDVPYLSNIDAVERFRVSSYEIAPFLSLGVLMEGIDLLAHCHFGCSLNPMQTYDGETWHGQIHKLAVVHESEGILGYIYCDLFDHPWKHNQNCHFTVRGGKQLSEEKVQYLKEINDPFVSSDGYQLPVVVLHLMLPLPTDAEPPLLSPLQAENLFHEFGHAMHSMLARTSYQHITGTRCSTDFAEVPSTLMEHFLWDPRVLGKIARHYYTGKSMAPSLVQQLCESRQASVALELQQSVVHAIVDQELHSGLLLDDPKSIPSILERVAKEHSHLPYMPKVRWDQRFNHFVTYGAKYHSYLVARSVSSLLWQKLFYDNPFNRDMGILYRNEILSHGGGKEPLDMLEVVLGSKPTVDTLVEALISDITPIYDQNNPLKSASPVEE